MGTLTYTLPTLGNPNATEDPLVRQALSDTKTEYNANIAAMLGTYKPLFNSPMLVIIGSTVASTLMISGSGGPIVSGANGQVYAKYIDPADYAIAGYTTKLRIRILATVNATAPAVNFTMGLYPVTLSGGAANLIYTVGTAVISGILSGPGASAVTTGVVSEVTMPAAQLLVPAVVVSGTTAANSQCSLSWQAQYRHV